MSYQALLIYLLRRILVFGLLLLVISFVVFSLLYISPGNAVDILLGDSPRTPELVHALRVKYHLDEPFLTQYWIWLKGAARLRFGDSIQTTLPVTDEIKSRLPVSIFLGIYAFIITMILGITLGIAAALFRRRGTDRFIVAGSVVGLSTPVFVSGILLLYVFAVRLPWFPPFGSGSGFTNQLWHLTLPAVALGTHVSAYVVKHTRAAMINVLDQDYIVFARARGLSTGRVLTMYALRNALIPVVTIGGIILSYLIVGAVLVEITFSIPGIGSLLVQAATNKDLPLLQGVTMIVALVIVLANLAADLLYLVVDPRVRLGRRPS